MKRILSSILVLALLMTMVPVAFAAGNSKLYAGDTAYEAKVGDVIEVPVYLTGAEGADLTVEQAQFRVPVPAGLTAEVEGGAIAADYLTVSTKNKRINVFYDGTKFTSIASAPLFTVKYTAETAGTYEIAFNTIEIYVPGQSDAIELDAVGTKITVSEETITPEPPVATNSGLYFGATAYEAKVGDVVEVPVYLTGAEGADLTVEQAQFRVPVPAGLAAEVEGGAIAADYLTVSTKNKRINVFYDGTKFTSTASAPLFTVKYTAETTGTYEIAFNTIEIYVPGQSDAIELATTATTITVTAGSTPVVPTLTGITANITAFEVPYGEDALTAVKAAITTVTAAYSDNTTATVADYTVALSEDGTKAIITYETATAEVALTYEPAPVVLTGITANITAFEVPYGEDALTAVKAAITTVTAAYSDNTTATVADYTVALSEDGTKAIITYETATAEVALTYEEAPVVPPATNSGLYFGATAYEAEVGDVVEVPVYLTGAEGADLTVEQAQFRVPVPAGLTAEVEGGAIAADYLTVSTKNKRINVFYDGTKFTSTASAPLFTVKYTAETAGTYEIAFNTIEIYVPGQSDAIELATTATTITVTGGEEPPVGPTITGITVNPTAIEVPYGVDAYTYVTSADGITGVTAVYSDNTTAPVTGYTVEIAGDKAIVTYEGKTAEIALTYGEAPVTDVEIVVAVTDITVPYGTADVEAYVKANVGEVKVKDSKGAERVVEATVVYDAANGYATVSYESLPAVQIPVKVIVLDSYALAEGTPESIEIPYDVTDVNAYVAGKVKVVANLSDGSTIDVADFTVEVGEATATVKVGEEVVGTIAVTYGQAPAAEIVDIKVEAADAIVVPYGTDDVAAYIKSKIVVKTVDADGVEAATDAYTVEVADGVATVKYSDTISKTVDYTVETVTISANVTTIEIPYTVTDIAAYIAANVTITVDYSAATADETVTLTADMIELDNGIAVIRVKDGEAPVEVTYTVQPAPEYIDTAVAAYRLEGKVLVKITGVADGKVAVVNGLQATYFGNGTFAVVADEDYTVVLEEVAAMPAVAEFGKLHDAAVSAFDALMTNDEALDKEGIPAFVDIQNFILADIDGNGIIEAEDALKVNRISLLGAEAVTTWVDAE